QSLHPLEERASVIEEALAGAGGVGVRAGSGRDVVVPLEVSRAVLLDEPGEHGIEVVASGGAAEVEEVAVVLDDANAATAHERLLRQFGGLRGTDADHLGLHPETRCHPALPDAVENRPEPARLETRRRRPPRADARPPIGPVVVPAGIDAERVRA